MKIECYNSNNVRRVLGHTLPLTGLCPKSGYGKEKLQKKKILYNQVSTFKGPFRAILSQKNILLEAEIDIEAAKSKILLQLDFDIMVVSSTKLIV